MKQPSTTSRGKKKSSSGKSSSSRGGASQHRMGGKSSGANRSSSSGSRSSSSSKSSGSKSASVSQSSRSGNRNGSGNGNSRGSGNSSGNRSSMRGNQPSSRSADRSWTANGSTRSSHEGRFQGQSYLEKLFVDLLQDIYYAENKITQALPKMIEAATTDELSEAFDDHLHQTQRHIKRLEKVFQTLGKQAEGKKCEAIEGIAREVENIIDETEEGTLTRDAALIIAAQKVEHYEIATYGGLVQLAITMQLHEAADLLDKTLVEEEDTDALLTEIAENDINLEAEHEGNDYSWSATMIYSGEGEEGEEEESEEEGEENEDEETDNPSAM